MPDKSASWVHLSACSPTLWSWQMVWVWHSLSAEQPCWVLPAAGSDYCGEKVSSLRYFVPTPSVSRRVLSSGTHSDVCKDCTSWNAYICGPFPGTVSVKLHQMTHSFQFYKTGKITPLCWLSSAPWCWRVLGTPSICGALRKHVPQNDCDPGDCFLWRGRDRRSVPSWWYIQVLLDLTLIHTNERW